jgi:cell division protein ZapE
MSFANYFQNYRVDNDFHVDPVQDCLAQSLSRLAEDLIDPPKRGLFSGQPKTPKGMYIWGGVGRGKTMLMDLFFDFLPFENKRRVHFNLFMLDVHNSITILRMDGKGKDPLPQIAAEIAENCRLLCFDEFQVYDIADAMVLSELFKALFKKGVTVIATSNVAPDNLYKDGLQRARFLPFIDVVKKHMTIIHLDNHIDYRQQALRENGTYFVGSIIPMDNLFEKMVAPLKPKESFLNIDSRVLPIEKAAGDIAFVSFQELCEKPRAAADYKILSDSFHTVFIKNIPRMGYDRRNELKRFILLIDTLYDAGKRVVIHAEDIPQNLYNGGTHAFEFERTISRLLEMQSEEYLQKSATADNVEP